MVAGISGWSGGMKRTARRALSFLLEQQRIARPPTSADVVSPQANPLPKACGTYSTRLQGLVPLDRTTGRTESHIRAAMHIVILVVLLIYHKCIDRLFALC